MKTPTLRFLIWFAIVCLPLFTQASAPVAAAQVQFTLDGTSSHLTPEAQNSLPLAIGGGDSHSCAVTATGGAKCWGWNPYGALGNGTTQNSNIPVDVTGLTSGVAAIAGGVYHTCAVLTSGGVKCWGLNTSGQLGNGSTTNSPTPVDVTGLTSGVIAIATGRSHTCALTQGGGVKCWGWNAEGELGNGTNTWQFTPVDVSGLTSGVIAISVGRYHTCALTATGGVKCWGQNDHGQLGNGTTQNSNVPVDVTALASGVSVISAGNGNGLHSCAVTGIGGVKCWGYNYSGQLGVGTQVDQLTPADVIGMANGISTVSAGYSHTCALTTNSAVKCWGINYYGEVNDPGLSWGVNAVSAGSTHTCILVQNAGVKCWGANIEGQLGDGTDSSSSSPRDVVGLALPTFSISGSVRDSAGMYISGANISDGAGNFVTTDNNGFYNLSPLLAGTYTVTASKRGYSFTPSSPPMTVPPNATQNFTANQSAVFQPNPDGYSFINQSRPLPSWDTFKQTFSNSNMEIIGGIPNPAAKLYYWTTYNGIWSGVCYGMASTSIAYYEGVEARPNGAITTYSISPNNAWHLIELYHGRQKSKGLLNYENNGWRTYPGVDTIYSQIKSRLPLQTGEDPFVITIDPGQDNSIPQSQRFGHALIPYRFEEQTGSWGKVYVYDPNSFGNLNRYFYFDFQAQPHSFDYDMGFPIPAGSSGNYHVRSGAGWAIELIPLSQFSTYDAKVLHDGILGWFIGAGNIMQSDANGNQLGYNNGTLVSTIPNSAPIYQEIVPGFSINTIGFSLPAGNYLATINNAGGYEYEASSITTTVDIRTQYGAGSQSARLGQTGGFDYVQLGASSTGVVYTSTLSTSHSVSIQLANDLPSIMREYDILNATMTGPGNLFATALPNGLTMQSQSLTSTFDLQIRGAQGNSSGWFLHRGIPVSGGAYITVNAPSLSASSVVTISVASFPGGPIEQTLVLNNQAGTVYLPFITK